MSRWNTTRRPESPNTYKIVVGQVQGPPGTPSRGAGRPAAGARFVCPKLAASFWDKLADVDKMIEVRYAGAVVSRSAVVRDLDARGLFIGLAEPLPVGTEVTLALDGDDVPAKVASVSESQELTRAGMRVVFTGPSSAELFRALADATPAAPMSGSGSARVMTSASASGSGSARVAAPASSSGSGASRVAAPAAPVSSPPVVDSKPAAPVPVPVPVAASAPVAAASTADGSDDGVDVSGPIASGEGGGAAAPGGPPSGGGAGGGGGGGRRNRRNRRR